MSHSVGVCSVVSDRALCIAGGSSSILLLGVTRRLVLVLDLLLSGVGLHCRAGSGVGLRVSAAHVGCGGDIADGGDMGDSCHLSCSGCLDGLLIVS